MQYLQGISNNPLFSNPLFSLEFINLTPTKYSSAITNLNEPHIGSNPLSRISKADFPEIESS